MVLEDCNFRRGFGGCSKKYEGATEEGGLSLYGKCDGEGNCIDFQSYRLIFGLVPVKM
ncbi:MAG: hypothetical protein KKB25_02930 [Nanoarchaeota archaeon]|nr:hypothetical protein [Nanoarchaeota archaeon]